MIGLVFATHNSNKLLEIQKMAKKLDLHIQSLNDIQFFEEIEENEPDLHGNSLTKAKTVYDQMNVNVFSDDTGLEVESLNGKPGVNSARYAGEPADSERNMDKLLLELEGETNRQARFRTVVTLILNGQIHQFEGVVEGEILNKRQGGEGFGYDPIFKPKGYNVSFAQMVSEEKNTISHRKRAFSKMIDFLGAK